MNDLRADLTKTLHGRICWMGLGNTDQGDDGFGVRLAEKLFECGVPNVIIAGNTPDRYMGLVTGKGFSHVVFLDAVDFGGASGSTIFADAGEIVARFPQVSTHKISLSLLAKWAEASGTKAWLLGVQPKLMARGPRLSSAVETTLSVLRDLIVEMRTPAETVATTGTRK
jgi:hydrogenase maturation protease